MPLEPASDALNSSTSAQNLSGTHLNACGCTACCSTQYFSSDGTVIEEDFAAQSSNFLWPQPNGKGSPITITYSYTNLFNGDIKGGITSAEMKSAIQEGFKLWANYAPLNFVEIKDKGVKSRTRQNAADIRIGQDAIDGQGGTLGRTNLRYDGVLANTITFDNRDQWETDRTNSASDFLVVATHEIGHALGLRHEVSNDAVMFPSARDIYSGLGSAFLYSDDINGIRSIYGQGKGSLKPLGGGNSGPTPGGSNPKDAAVITGTQGKDVLKGSSRAQTFKALGGNDVIKAGGGNDELLGGSGSDRLMGQNGRDTLIGVATGVRKPGLNERDILIGGGDRDLFVLGDRRRVFYNDGKANSLGKSDYALIRDFNRSSGDKIQLKGRAGDYRLGSAPKGTGGGKGIFLETRGQDELIGVVKGNNGLSLKSSAFTFV